jgi:hypothetical protein
MAECSRHCAGKPETCELRQIYVELNPEPFDPDAGNRTRCPYKITKTKKSTKKGEEKDDNDKKK